LVSVLAALDSHTGELYLLHEPNCGLRLALGLAIDTGLYGTLYTEDGWVRKGGADEL
jgi:hypothetical protein